VWEPGDSIKGLHIYYLTKTFINMKSLLLMIIFTGIFMGAFFALSAIGLLWCDSYRAIISNTDWFMCYFLFIGWWVAMIPTHELYEQVYNEN